MVVLDMREHGCTKNHSFFILDGYIGRISNKKKGGTGIHELTYHR
jgi:hypothetical protein